MIYAICSIMFIYVCFVFALVGRGPRRGHYGRAEALQAPEPTPSLSFGPDPNPQMMRCIGCFKLIPLLEDVYSECESCKFELMSPLWTDPSDCDGFI